MSTLIDIIYGTYPLTNETQEKLLSLIETHKFSAKHKLEESGKQATCFYFLIEGIVRAYSYSSKDEKESNLDLFFKNSFFSSFESLIKGTPSHLDIECLTDCVIAKCNYNEFIKLTNQCPDLNLGYIKSLENLLILNETRDIEFATLTATDRYIALRKRFPKIDNLISQKHIASYLGITTVQLSRLRKKLYSQ